MPPDYSHSRRHTICQAIFSVQSTAYAPALTIACSQRRGLQGLRLGLDFGLDFGLRCDCN